jgi:anti-sigma factor RsiW
MKKTCGHFEEMLVDYTDGRLSPEDSNEVAEHSARCEHCRALLDSLQKSLDLAGVIWTDSLADTEKICVQARPDAEKSHWLRYAAIAASILIVVTASVVWRMLREPEQPELTFAQIERSITESATAARLLAATELLADCPNAQAVVDQQYRHIVQTYPETSAASEARLRIQ